MSMNLLNRLILNSQLVLVHNRFLTLPLQCYLKLWDMWRKVYLRRLTRLLGIPRLWRHVGTSSRSQILGIKNSLDFIKIGISHSRRRPCLTWYFTDMTQSIRWTQYIGSWAPRLPNRFTNSLKLNRVTSYLSIQIWHTNLSHLILNPLLKFDVLRISGFRSSLARLHFVF